MLTGLPAGVEVLIRCRKQDRRGEVPPYVNGWWACPPLYGGCITDIHVRSPGDRLPDVPLR
ncbi:hypothetical protein [Streptomyces sp. NPDC048737]|uniref:hypothetical protein n=1 Tax=unclassified Streptomyces TaxID=2593676 RepID=UPI00343D517B